MKTYQPIHSSNPELRFVVEKATMEKPAYRFGSLAYDLKLEEYNKHLASLTKYPFPALTKEMPDELVEGVDFGFQHQESYHRYNFNNWHNVSKPAHDEVFESTSIVHRRIIAVPLSVKAESIPTQSGESMQDVLGKYMDSDRTRESIYVAMSEWASIQCKEMDAEIAQLKEDYNIQNHKYAECAAGSIKKEAAIKELVEGFVRIIEFQEENITKLTSAQILVHINNYIGSIITKYKPTTP